MDEHEAWLVANREPTLDELPIPACRALWGSVIIQMFDDAFPKINKRNEIYFYNSHGDRNFCHAHMYLSRPSKDLTAVCDLADINAEKVVELYWKRMDGYFTSVQGFYKRSDSGKVRKLSFLILDELLQKNPNV